MAVQKLIINTPFLQIRCLVQEQLSEASSPWVFLMLSKAAAWMCGRGERGEGGRWAICSQNSACLSCSKEHDNFCSLGAKAALEEGNVLTGKRGCFLSI
jgi:hypothetical protein